MSISLVRKLQQEIFDLTGGFIASWLPDFEPLVGDFGTLSRGRLLGEGNLEEQGYIDVGYYVGTSEVEDFKYSHEVTMSAKASIEGSGTDVTLTFNDEGSFVYHFQNAKTERIANKGVFYKELAFKIITGEIPWEDGYIIVDEVVVAEKSSIIISKSRGGSLSFSLDQSPQTELNLADTLLSFSYKNLNGTIMNYSGKTFTRPMYHAVKPTIKPLGSVAGRRGPKPTGPSLAKLYEHVKGLVGGREVRATEIELYAAKEDLVEAKLILDGNVAEFQIAFESISPSYAIEDNLADEVTIPVKKMLMFHEM